MTSLFYHVVDVAFDKITARACAKTTSDGACAVDAGDTVELVLKDASRVLPFVNRHVCYRFIINNASGANVVCGCPSVSVPEKALDPKGALSDALARGGPKDAKMKLLRAFKRFGAAKPRDPRSASGAYAAVVREIFDDADLAEDFRASFRAAHGWFLECPSMRAVGKGLFCMGFHDRDSVRRVLGAVAKESAGPEWFESVGHGGADERDEDFKQLYARFRKMDAHFLQFVREIALEDPSAFFAADTRPMALRALGALDREFFAHFCAGSDGDLTLPTRDAELTLADREKGADATTVLRVDQDHVTGNTMALVRTLTTLRKSGILRFESETDLIRRGGALFDCGMTLTGRGNAVREVHTVCSTKRVCLGFDSTAGGRAEVDTLKNRFVTATAPSAEGAAVSAFVRDAHLLGCAQLAHVLWRTAGRAAFRELVLSTRFEYDAAYAGTAAPFIAALARVAQVAQVAQVAPRLANLKSTTENVGAEAGVSRSVADLTPASLASFSGVCVVPTARDAIGSGDAEATAEGCAVFVISPPLFGRVARVNGKRSVTVTLPVEGSETEVSTFEKNKNVWASATTAARGVLVPASALLFQRKRFPMCSAKATVFVPTCFSPERRRDLIEATRAFFRNVTIVDVEAYDVPAMDDLAARRVVEVVETSL